MEGVHKYQDVGKLGLDDGPSVISPVFAPHYVYFVVAKVTDLRRETVTVPL